MRKAVGITPSRLALAVVAGLALVAGAYAMPGSFWGWLLGLPAALLGASLIGAGWIFFHYRNSRRNAGMPALQEVNAVRGPFTLVDPYAGPGSYYKAQLHLHTDLSDGRWSLDEALDHYASLGFDVVAVTDHDAVHPDAIDPRPSRRAVPLLISGEEHTLAEPFYPLGRHLVRLFVDSRLPRSARKDPAEAARATERAGGVAVVAHPSWTGKLFTARWTLADLAKTPGIGLIEIVNPNSSARHDAALWTKLLQARFPEPVWASAVDNAHGPGERVGRGWVMIKSEALSPAAIRRALLRGAFYPTTGALADFSAREGAVCVSSRSAQRIRFIDVYGNVVEEAEAESASYTPRGDEGLIRVEVEDDQGRMAWSQPFYIRPEQDADGRGEPRAVEADHGPAEPAEGSEAAQAFSGEGPPEEARHAPEDSEVEVAAPPGGEESGEQP